MHNSQCIMHNCGVCLRQTYLNRYRIYHTECRALSQFKIRARSALLNCAMHEAMKVVAKSAHEARIQSDDRDCALCIVHYYKCQPSMPLRSRAPKMRSLNPLSVFSRSRSHSFMSSREVCLSAGQSGLSGVMPLRRQHESISFSGAKTSGRMRACPRSVYP